MERPDFAQWLQSELDLHRWSRADFARLTGISAPQITRILNREQQPGEESIKAIARVLKKKQLFLYQIAGKLPLDKKTPDEQAETLYDQIMSLPESLRKQAIDYVSYLYYRKTRKDDETATDSSKKPGQR